VGANYQLLITNYHYHDTVQQVTNPDEWNRLLAAFPDAHPLQSWTWGAFKGRWGWSARPLILQVNEANQPQAAALLLKRPLPRLPYCILYVPRGPLLDYGDARLRRLVLNQLEQIARQERAIFVKIDPAVVQAYDLDSEPRLSPTGAAVRRELEERGWRFSADQIQFRNSVTLDLELSEEELLARMKQKTRYNIRLASRKGVTIRAGSPDDFNAFFSMYATTAVRDGFTIRPQAYYLDIWSQFQAAGQGQLLLAEYEGQLLGGVFLVAYGRQAIYMYGASSELERPRMPNYLLQWEAIRWAKAAGYRLYDMWGAPDEFVETDRLWGVWRFKSGFNGQVVGQIGAWDYSSRPALYWLYTVAIPRYLVWLRGKSEK
jgi:peptidoglycan pentaglycine glycine transferase (the first glycine)